MRVLVPQYLKRGAFRKGNYPREWASKLTDMESDFALTRPDTQCWDDIKRIRDMWPGYMLVKGLQSLEDAVIAADYGLDGVVLSNHGGRYLDSAPAPVQLVPEVRRAVGDRLKIIIDSGARRGSDLVKAIAKAPVNKVATSLTPVLSLPVETLSNRSFWPDVFNPRQIRFDDPFITELLDSITVIRDIQKANGVEGCHRYIISNCQSALDVIRVFQLAKLLLAKGDEC